MKIIGLNENGQTPVKAVAYINGNTKHFNIIHGIKGFWEYRLGIVDRFAKPENEDDVLELNDNDYIIKPVISRATNDYYKDARDNNVFNLDKGSSEINNDCLVLWTIPNKRYTDVKYIIKGQCEVLGEAETGIERPDAKYISPAPVVEVYGSCELSWTAKKQDGSVVKQVIKYDYKQGSFNIGVVEVIKVGNNEKV